MKQLLQITFTLTLLASAAFAAPGDLDTTFGGDGRVFNFFGNADEKLSDFAVQTDGKIVAVGTVRGDFLIARYNINGTLDTTFGGGIAGNHFGEAGKVIVDVGLVEFANAVEIDSSGKIIVAGSTGNGTLTTNNSNDIAILRLNTNGSLDTGFGINGFVITNINAGTDVARDMDLQIEGEIVIATGTHIVRYNATGSLDTSFDGDGIRPVAASVLEIQRNSVPEKIVASNSGFVYRFNINGSFDTTFDGDGILPIQTGLGTALKLQTDGKILSGGFISNGTDNDFAVARFLPNGSLDTTFDSDGTVITNISSLQDFVTDISIQSDGKIIAVGNTKFSPTSTDTSGNAAVRYNPNGSLDTSFDSDGIILNLLNGFSLISFSTVTVQPSGNILFGGYAPTTTPTLNPSSSNDFNLIRCDLNGNFDNSFGISGFVSGELRGFAVAKQVKFQSDGKMVVVGALFDTEESFFLARYNNDGSLDTSFSDDGVVTAVLLFGPTYVQGNSLAFQSDGKILVGGTRRPDRFSGSNDFFLSRINSDGTFDQTFINGGFTSTAVGIGNDVATSVAAQPDGKILVGGVAQSLGYSVVRFNSDGFIDTTFDGDGKASFGFANVSGSTNVIFSSMLLQSNGKIIFTGSTADLTAIRINANGTIDSSFGVNGAASAINAGVGRAAVLQPDGKIIVVGAFGNPQTNPIAARYNSDGTLDTSFGTNGVAVIPSGANGIVPNSVTLQSDGKIVIGGEAIDTTGNSSDFAVIRLLPNGSAESSLWGNNGIVTTNLGNDDRAYSVAIQPDGKVIAVGGSGLNGAGAVSLVRYQALAPTAATATINGRVTTASNRAIRNVALTLTDTTTGETKSTITNPFGYYNFQDLEVGRSYVLTIKSKRFSFANPTRTITLDENLTGEDFIADEK
jgi:uncharacterized delta-60 repeat protein